MELVKFLAMFHIFISVIMKLLMAQKVMIIEFMAM